MTSFGADMSSFPRRAANAIAPSVGGASGAGRKGASASSFARDAAFPRISIIVPVYNERRVIGGLVDQLLPVADRCEIVFVDGGSADGTCALIPDGMQVVGSRKGRGVQLRAGVRQSSGDVLFFLHADSVLPEGFLDEIARVMRTSDYGCFGVSFQPASPLMRVCRFMSNARVALRGIAFGDQGMFMTRELLERAGGVPELPLMEDYELSRTLRSMGYRPKLARRRIVTSARRYGTSPLSRLRTMYHMAYLRRIYRTGASVEEVARAYRDVR